MMPTRQNILDQILDHFPLDAAVDSGVGEAAVLTDLGVTSLHVITLLLELQPTYGVGLSQLADAGMPVTVGDLVTLIETGARA